MPITIGSNIVSLRALRALDDASSTVSKVYERLSSGMRINRASDDAAGLAIATSLNADARVFSQAIRNVNDGISLLSVADGALSELSNVVIRMRELAEGAANGTYSTKQRQTMTIEARALTEEWNRIIQSTTFNGVKLLDLSNSSISIQAGYGSNSVLSVDLGSKLARVVGDGTFQTGVSYATNTLNPENIASYDFNGDGLLDVVTANQGELNVFLGNGDGTLRVGVSYVSASAPGALSIIGLTLADFNNDGKIDVATTSDGDNTLDILFGNGNGTFRAPVSYASGTDTAAMSSGDFNGDGILDLVTTSLTTPLINIFIGNSDGSFKARISYTADAFPNDVQVGDVSGDGILDIVVSAGSGNGTDVFIGRGDGTFAASAFYASGTGVRGFSLVDVNNDDLLDIVAPALSDSSINVLINNGNGTFKAKSSVAAVAAVMIKTGDINGDGIADIIANGAGGVTSLIGNGNGTFKAPSAVASGARQITLADFNRDGVLDVAVADEAGDKVWMHMANTTRVTTLARPTMNTQAQARDLISIYDATLERIGLERGQIGAMQSRYGSAVRHLSTIRLGYQEAESRIRDVDVAEQSSQLVRAQILQQIGAAILAQANQAPALVLQLIRDE